LHRDVKKILFFGNNVLKFEANIKYTKRMSSSMLFFFAVLYSLVAFFAFMLMPFMYFYYEEKDEDATTRQVNVVENCNQQ